MTHIRKSMSIFALLFVVLNTHLLVHGQDETASNIQSIAWSPDGSQIAVGRGSEICNYEDAAEHEIQILDATTLQVTQNLIGHFCAVTSLDWRSDGIQLVSTGGIDGTALVWDVAKGMPISISSIQMLERYMDMWSPDDTKIASIGNDAGIEIWNPKTGDHITSLDGGGDAIMWSPDGSQLVTGDEVGNIVIWTASTGKHIKMEGHYGTVSAVLWSSDGQTIVSGGWDKTIKVWDAKTGSLRHTLGGHTGIVARLSLNSDGNTLASASYDGTVRIWNINTGDLYQTISSPKPMYAVDWSPDGKRLAYGGASVDGEAKGLQIVDVDQLQMAPLAEGTP